MLLHKLPGSLALFLGSVLLTFQATSQATATRSTFSNPIELPTEMGSLNAEEGYVAVPENRRETDSRTILVQYMRIPARTPSTANPLFILPGGPGDLLDRRDFEKHRFPHISIREFLWEITKLRDVVVVNQRANHWVIGPNGGFQARQPDFVPAATAEDEALAAWKASYKETFDFLSANGVDLRGYDIINCVEDVEDIRVALGYGKIILKGASFGSQWSLSYMRTHPENVARASLGGVEPIDYGYDDPGTLWNTMKRIAVAAETSPISDELPGPGLAEAIRIIVARLSAEPAQVEIHHPDTGDSHTIPVHAEDFQQMLIMPWRGLWRGPWRGMTVRESTEMWPKFVTEVYNGDYRFIALRKLQGLWNSSGDLAAPLIDHSLGISRARDARLQADTEALAVMGDPNSHYRAWADITPTPVVSDEFRALRPIDAPVLLIHGDMDWSTPLENAVDQSKHLRNGALVTVHAGTHLASAEIIYFDTELAKKEIEFINMDLASEPDFEAFFSGLPDSITLPLNFLSPDDTPLYERMLADEF